jgi:hypothetical protein
MPTTLHAEAATHAGIVILAALVALPLADAILIAPRHAQRISWCGGDQEFTCTIELRSNHPVDLSILDGAGANIILWSQVREFNEEISVDYHKRPVVNVFNNGSRIASVAMRVHTNRWLVIPIVAIVSGLLGIAIGGCVLRIIDRIRRAMDQRRDPPLPKQRPPISLARIANPAHCVRAKAHAPLADAHTARRARSRKRRRTPRVRDTGDVHIFIAPVPSVRKVRPISARVGGRPNPDMECKNAT